MSATLLSSLLARMEAEDFDEEQWRLLFKSSLRIGQESNLANLGDSLSFYERMDLQKALLRSPMIDTDLLEKSQSLPHFESLVELGHNPMATLWLESSPDGSGAKMLGKAMRISYNNLASSIAKAHYNLYFDNLLLLLQNDPWNKAFKNEPYLENCFTRVHQGIAPDLNSGTIMIIKISENIMRSARTSAGKALLLHQWFHALERIVAFVSPIPETPLCFIEEK